MEVEKQESLALEELAPLSERLKGVFRVLRFAWNYDDMARRIGLVSQWFVEGFQVGAENMRRVAAEQLKSLFPLESGSYCYIKTLKETDALVVQPAQGDEWGEPYAPEDEHYRVIVGSNLPDGTLKIPVSRLEVDECTGVMWAYGSN